MSKVDAPTHRRSGAPTALAYFGASVRRSMGPALAALAAITMPAMAQIGHNPATSPFRDVNTRQSLTLMAGYFFGDETEAGVGALGGEMVGLRFTSRLSGPIELMANVGYIRSSRYVIDTQQPAATRKSGPIDFPLVEADIGLLFSLTGIKSWKGLQPYLAFGIGVMAPTESTVDPGGYKAGANFSFAPSIGARWHVGRRLALNVELRDNTMRYEWPLSYFRPTDSSNNPITPPVLDPARYDDKDLTHQATLTFGLSYRFNF